MGKKENNKYNPLLKRSRISIYIIVGVILLAMVLLVIKNFMINPVSEDLVYCISNHSILYTQVGCHFCLEQESYFGDNYKLLNIVDCFHEQKICVDKGIRITPTWIVDGVEYKGVLDIKELKNITGCK